MSADDQYEPAPEQGFPSNADYPSNVDTSSAYSGNRPASGARRATPGEVLSQGFQGAENAGDFLGLDVEFTGAQGAGLGDSLDLVPPPGTYAPGEELAAPEPAPMPEGDAAQEFAQAPSAFEFGEDLGSEEGGAEEAFADADSPAASKVPLLVGGFLLAALGGAGYFFGPGLYAQYFGKSATEVAQAPAGTEKTEKPSKGSGATKSEPKGGEIAALPPTGAGEPAVKLPAEAGEGAAAQPKGAESRPPRTSGGGETTTPALLASQPELEPVAPLSAQDEAVVASSTPPRSASFPDVSGPEYDWAGSSQLELIWRGSEVPLEAVRAPVRTLMPKVGQVRVFTTSGDVFDGRLYAVGQNRVWVDAAPGRIGLDGELVERIEVLPPEQQTGAVADGAPVAGGKQVRARVAGGVLYGRILKSSGDSVMLALEDGGRVIVRAGDIEDIGSGRAVVVRR
jgi:hypothetical protein